MAQTPRGPEDKVCPELNKAMSKVCHSCPLWMPVEIGSPATVEWRCAKVVAAQAALVNAERLEARMTELVTELGALRNEMKVSHDHNVALGAMAVQRSKEAVKSALNEIADARQAVALGTPHGIKAISG